MAKEAVFAVLRFDPPWVEDAEQGVTVVKVMRSQAEAEAETARLNDLNGDKGCRYVLQATRLYTIE
jgi:hypothetical protein